MVLIKFFCFWQFSDIGLRASELGICPYTGKWEYIRSNMRWLPKTYAIFVHLSLSLSLFNDKIITAPWLLILLLTLLMSG